VKKIGGKKSSPVLSCGKGDRKKNGLSSPAASLKEEGRMTRGEKTPP